MFQFVIFCLSVGIAIQHFLERDVGIEEEQLEDQVRGREVQGCIVEDGQDRRRRVEGAADSVAERRRLRRPTQLQIHRRPARRLRRTRQHEPGILSPARARLTEYLTTVLRLSYDNAKVTIDLRRTSNSLNVLRRTRGFSEARFTCKIRYTPLQEPRARFTEYLTIYRKLILGDSVVAEWLACWTQAQKGLGSNRSRDAVG